MAKPQNRKQAEPKVDLPDGANQDTEQENSVMEASQRERVRHPGPWTKLSSDEIIKHSLAGNLIGHDPMTGEVILKDADLKV